MKKLPLIGGGYTLVDDDDYEFFKERKLYKNDSGYAVTYEYPNSTSVVFRLHRLITSAPKGMDVDHKNGDRLDNRRENLRLCSRSQNNANRRDGSASKSGYKGVIWNKSLNKWVASIKINRRSRHLGVFVSKEAAANAYANAAQLLFGEFASPYLQIPPKKG